MQTCPCEWLGAWSWAAEVQSALSRALGHNLSWRAVSWLAFAFSTCHLTFDNLWSCLSFWSYAVLSLPGKEQAAPESWIWPGRNWCWVVRHSDCMNIHGPRRSAKKNLEDEDRHRKHGSTIPNSLQRRPSVMPATDSIPGRMRSVLHTKRWDSVAWKTPTHGALNLLRRFESVLLYFVLSDKMLQVFCEGNGDPYCIRGDYLPSSHCKAGQARKGSLGQVAALPCSAKCRIVRQARAGSLGSSGFCWPSVEPFQPILSQKDPKSPTTGDILFHDVSMTFLCFAVWKSGKQKELIMSGRITRTYGYHDRIIIMIFHFCFEGLSWSQRRNRSRGLSSGKSNLFQATSSRKTPLGCMRVYKSNWRRRAVTTRSWYH